MLAGFSRSTSLFVGCFDNDEAKACELGDGGNSTGAIYLFRQCYNASVVALGEFIPEFNDTIANKKANLSDSERIPAAQEYFKLVHQLPIMPHDIV